MGIYTDEYLYKRITEYYSDNRKDIDKFSYNKIIQDLQVNRNIMYIIYKIKGVIIKNNNYFRHTNIFKITRLDKNRLSYKYYCQQQQCNYHFYFSDNYMIESNQCESRNDVLFTPFLQLIDRLIKNSIIYEVEKKIICD